MLVAQKMSIATIFNAFVKLFGVYTYGWLFIWLANGTLLLFHLRAIVISNALTHDKLN